MDTLFFVAAKLAWGLLQPDNWYLVGIAVVVLALVRGRVRLALAAAAATAAFVLALGLLPVGQWLLVPLERQYPYHPAVTGPVTGIIVLGGGEVPDPDRDTDQDGPRLSATNDRFSEAAALARRYPQARVVYSGGSGALADLGRAETEEGRIARRVLAGAGIAADRLTFETGSRNTAENAALSLAMVQPPAGSQWLLVTSAFHMPRALRSFRRAGWPGVVPWPTDYRTSRPARPGWRPKVNTTTLTLALKEYLGALVYGVTGR